MRKRNFMPLSKGIFVLLMSLLITSSCTSQPKYVKNNDLKANDNRRTYTSVNAGDTLWFTGFATDSVGDVCKQLTEVDNGYATHITFRSDDGVLTFELSLKNNKKDGVCREYYEDGSLKKEETYKLGILHGKLKRYFENGNLKYDEEYFEGKLNGKCLSYYEDGSVESDLTYRNDIEDGLCEYYSEEGKKFVVNYSAGIPDKLRGKYSNTSPRDVLGVEKIIREYRFVSDSEVSYIAKNQYGKTYKRDAGEYKINDGYIVITMKNENLSMELKDRDTFIDNKNRKFIR
jgi:antitoxin component YwqK of YwqJK toxin-antitoxin module